MTDLDTNAMSLETIINKLSGFMQIVQNYLEIVPVILTSLFLGPLSGEVILNISLPCSPLREDQSKPSSSLVSSQVNQNLSNDQ